MEEVVGKKMKEGNKEKKNLGFVCGGEKKREKKGKKKERNAV